MSKVILQMKNVSKSFPGVKALDKACIEVNEGEVHALMGENGAGKSTLMKVLNGLLQADEGEVMFNGKNVHINSPADALKLGIAMIYQELNPIRDMTIAENIFLGREATHGKSFFVDRNRNNENARVLLKQFHLDVEPSKYMRTLSIAQMQMIEIIKAVSTGAKVIVMDEPTSSLTDEEIKVLFSTIKELKEKKVAIIYITHRMDEIFAISDRVTVLRDGKYIGTKHINELDRNSLIHMMVGRELDAVFPKKIVPIKDTVLKVDKLSKDGQFQEISFEVKAGEILGFYGLVGAGRSELFRCIFGLDRYDSGSIFLNGEQMNIKRTEDAISNGIVMVTEDRKETGLVLCRSIKENISLPNLEQITKGIFIKNDLETQKSLDITNKLKVKMNGLSQDVQNLSGGNQQKVVLCKWLMKHPKLLILDEPTRGIDVGAKSEIHSLMCKFAEQGMAIVLISSELPEVMGMSDRVFVMGEGRIKGEFCTGEYNQDDILKCALGGIIDEAI